VKAVHAFTPAALALLVSGCVVPMPRTPGRGNVPAQTVLSLQAAQSTRAQTLMTVGAPDRRLLDDRVFGYLWYEALAAAIFPAGYQVGGFTVWGKRMLLIEFDAQGRLVRTGVVGAMTASGLDEAVKAWVAPAPDAPP
jgi:hypothetical protein